MGRMEANEACSAADGMTDARSRLLAAAGPIFAQQGFDRATVREISSAAGVNLASIGYYFGDKMGLYREVIRDLRRAREARYPVPIEVSQEPRRELAGLVHTMLSRMLAKDDRGWESQLLMREMQFPTDAFEEIVNESFRPIFIRLVGAIERLTQSAGENIALHVNQQLALSVVGQCLYYRVGRRVIETLIPADERAEHYDIDSLCRHVIAVTLAAAEAAATTKSFTAVGSTFLSTTFPIESKPISGDNQTTIERGLEHPPE